MAENRIVAMPPVSRTISLPLTNIYAIVDVSSSMQGPKIEAVCSSIRRMFMSWPPGMNFQLTVFNDSTTTIVSGPKRNTKIEDAINGIKRICYHGGKTALYDAWGEVLTSIPEAVEHKTQVFIISDGDDNSSIVFSLQEVKAVTEEKQASGVQICFIQVGTNGRIWPAIGGLRHGNIRMLRVENSSRGIQLALSDVNNRIQQQLQIGSAGNGSNLQGLESRRMPRENQSTFTVNKLKYLPRRKW